ncbi:uncharacterized protein LOC125370952 [Ricinus communis]|uniref:uncharacterized protein LOC125370952 n=1 Tax=Ricinus communis TaxID=3988 RepID=UPI00201AC06F|nr:uncharacterized protein LOC125370952 [Ricinus communis]
MVAVNAQLEAMSKKMDALTMSSSGRQVQVMTWASNSVMPYKLFKKLGLREPEPNFMSIQLADKSVVYPKGIIEDVLVKIQEFIFLVNFVIINMDEDVDVSLILGRPFLATARSVIDVHDGKLILKDCVKTEREPPKKQEDGMDIPLVKDEYAHRRSNGKNKRAMIILHSSISREKCERAQHLPTAYKAPPLKDYGSRVTSVEEANEDLGKVSTDELLDKFLSMRCS